MVVCPAYSHAMKLWLPLLLSLFVIAAAPVPDKAAWKAGAMIYGSHPTRWSEKTEEHITTTVMELRKSLNP